MLKVAFRDHLPRNILCLGAHCDDIEIGCGGTILRYCSENQDINIYWVVFSSEEERKKEAISSANGILGNVKSKTVVINKFKNSYFPYVGDSIKDYFEDLKRCFNPDIVFTHCRGDLHQDHRVINELTWNTYRNHLIFEYEIAKYDADLGSPNVFVYLSEEICKSKTNHILKHFTSQSE
jgi:LmbE family N-acetylglucosaminyl deacetylase